MLKADAGVDILHVPFRGGADTPNQVMGGRIDLGITNLPSAIELIRAGRLHCIAVTSPERTPALPEVPTVAESGLPGYAATAWFGLQVPRGMATAIIRRLNAEVNAICAEPTTRSRIEAVGARLLGGSPEDFATFIAAEGRRWAEVIRRSGAKVD
jgi:tripartite-type tricarboxylate transporter receptor subunit TctC